MLLGKKAQSTAEYAILIGVVIAVAAGVLQVALKGGVRQKNKQALNYLLSAGNTETAFNATTDTGVALYSQEFSKTTVDAADYKDATLLKKGGAVESIQQQKTATTSVSLETINATE